MSTTPTTSKNVPVPMSAIDALQFIGPNAKQARRIEKTLQNLLKRLEPSESTLKYRAQVYEYFSNILLRINSSCFPYVIEHPSLDISMPDGDVKVGVYVSHRKARDLFNRCTNTLLLRSQMSKPAYYLKTIAAATHNATPLNPTTPQNHPSRRPSQTTPTPAPAPTDARRLSRSEPVLEPKLVRTPTPTAGAAWGDRSRTTSLFTPPAPQTDKAAAPTAPLLPTFPVSAVTVIDSLACVLHCAVGETTLTLTSNTSLPLARLGFTHGFAAATTVPELYASSLALLRLWGFREARVLCLDEQRQGLRISALEVMLMMVINCYMDVFQAHKYDTKTGIPSLNTDAKTTETTPEATSWTVVDAAPTTLPVPVSPLLVLHTFFSVYSHFDFNKYCVTVAGPLPIAAFRHALVKHKTVPQPDLPPAWGRVTLTYPSAEAPNALACVPAAITQLLADEYGLLAGKKAAEVTEEHEADATPATETGFASAERILAQVKQLRAPKSESATETPETEATTVSWTCPTSCMFHFGPANIVDFVNPCDNIGSSLNETDLAAVQASFASGLRSLNQVLSSRNMDVKGILHALFPSLAAAGNIFNDVEATLQSDSTVREQPAYDASVEIAKVQRQLLRVREFVKSQLNSNKK